MSAKKLGKCPTMQKSFGTNGKSINEVIFLLYILKSLFKVVEGDVGDKLQMLVTNLSSTHFASNIRHQHGYGLNILIGYKSLKELTESKKTNCFDFAIMYALCAQNYYKRYRKLVWLAILFIIFITFRRKIIGMISQTDKLANN